MLFNYTTELRTFFENNPEALKDPPKSHKELIEMGRKKLFDFDYPIFDEAYRNVFETHFIRNFYMREIGFETFGLFKFRLETWLIINMPYWNKMLESELLKYDPLTNSKMDVTATTTKDKTQNDKTNRTIDGETNSESNRNGTLTNTETSNTTGHTEGTQTKDDSGSVIDDNFNRQLESNNPDSRLALTANDGEGVIEYASSIKENNENNNKTTIVKGENTNTDDTTVDTERTGTATNTDKVTDATISNIAQDETLTSTINDVEDFIQHRVGKIGVQSFAKMVQEYRSSLLRIERQIFDEMNELFMLVY